MIPTIWPEDVLMISKISPEDIQPGQIALYRRDRRLFIHRVVVNSGNTEQVLMRGDCMPLTDPPVPIRDLLGRVDFILRNGEKIVPLQNIPLAQRVVAAFVRSSEIGARAVFGVRRLYRNLGSSTPQWGEESCQL
jgi:hypothetical protein